MIQDSMNLREVSLISPRGLSCPCLLVAHVQCLVKTPAKCSGAAPVADGN